MKSKKRLKVASVTSLFFLTALLNGCAKSQIQYEAVKVSHPPLPASLLSECPIPTIPKEMTFGDSVSLNMALLGSLDECNGKLRGIGKIEELRSQQ